MTVNKPVFIMLSKVICWPLGIGTFGLLHSRTRKFLFLSNSPSISPIFIPAGKQLSSIPQSQMPSMNFSGLLIVTSSTAFDYGRRRKKRSTTQLPSCSMVIKSWTSFGSLRLNRVFCFTFRTSYFQRSPKGTTKEKTST
jgi:hypothetical protein